MAEPHGHPIMKTLDNFDPLVVPDVTKPARPKEPQKTYDVKPARPTEGEPRRPGIKVGKDGKWVYDPAAAGAKMGEPAEGQRDFKEGDAVEVRQAIHPVSGLPALLDDPFVGQVGRVTQVTPMNYIIRFPEGNTGLIYKYNVRAAALDRLEKIDG